MKDMLFVRRAMLVCFAVFVALFRPPDLLAQNVIFSGTVEDSAGRVIVGAQVTLHTSSGAVVTARTDAAGYFFLSTGARGPATLTIEARGFEILTREIALSSAQQEQNFTLRIAGEQQTVTVTASTGYTATEASSGTKMDLPLMETPISVQVIPQQVLKDQQIVNLIDAITNVSGVAPTNDSYGTSDSFSIRGFDAAALIYQDGLRLDEYSDSGFAQDMANVEQVEVVKGPASVLYGQGEPGGLVNIITKKPRPNRFDSFQQQFGGHGYYRAIADVNQPLVDRRLYSRLVFDGLSSDSFRNFIHTNELSFFPSLKWQLSDLADLTLQGSYQTGSDYTDNGIPFQSYPVNGSQIVAIGYPAPVIRSSNFVDYGSNKVHTRQFDIKPFLTIHLGENWPLRIIYKYAYITTPPTSGQLYPGLDEVYVGNADSKGDLARFGFVTDYFHHRTNQVIADLPGSFTIGKVKNTVLVGFDYSKDTGAYDYNTVFPATINIFNPVYNQPIPPPDPSGQGWNTLGYIAYGAYAQDLVQLPWHIFVLAGVRMNWAYAYENYAGAYVGNSAVHERPTNPRGGLLWQADDHVSLYSSYSSNYGDSALGQNAPGQKFLPPESANQVEFGVKTEWLNRRLTASTAVYRIFKHNVPAPDPSNPALVIAIGTARTQGIEFDVAGQVTRDLRVIASYSNFQSVTTKDTNVPSQQGLPFGSVPHFTESFWTTWGPQEGPVRGFRLGGGVGGHSGEQAYQTVFDANYNPLGLEADKIGSYATINLMGGYQHSWDRKSLSIQMNIENLLNKHYFSNVNPAQGMPGGPFNIIPAMDFRF